MKLDALAFGAHPDDVELSCSGTMIKLAGMGYKTGVINLTKAELGTRGSAEIRQKEFAEAGVIMGLNVHKALDIPDGNVEVTWDNKLKIIKEIREYKPNIVFAPYWVVRHPDHGYTSNLVQEASFLAGLKKIDTSQEAYRPYKIIYYQSRFEFTPSFIVDISDVHDKKIEAIKAYKSQFFHEEMDKYGSDMIYISRPEFLDAIVTRARQYGNYIGVQFGEPFLVREAMHIKDPVEFFGPEYLNTIP